jgi:hypothetical protein
VAGRDRRRGPALAMAPRDRCVAARRGGDRRPARGDFRGIEGFSTTNYGWLAFSITGGIGLAWRPAGRAATWQMLARPLVAAAAAYAVCFVAVAMMGLLFIHHQSLGETLTTDSPGRALTVAIVVAAVGYLIEIVRAAMRAATRIGTKGRA